MFFLSFCKGRCAAGTIIGIWNNLSLSGAKSTLFGFLEIHSLFFLTDVGVLNPNVAKVGGLQSQACYNAVSLELK
jgi:hypothetical protein